MTKDNPFEGIPKTKMIRGVKFKLYTEGCFAGVGMLQSELNYLRSAGYSAHRHKKGKWYFIYLRKG